jgi:hypothetical protein
MCWTCNYAFAVDVACTVYCCSLTPAFWGEHLSSIERANMCARPSSRYLLQVTALLLLPCSGFETDKLPVHSSLVPVLARLLSFTPNDLRRLDVRKSKTWLPPWQP